MGEGTDVQKVTVCIKLQTREGEHQIPEPGAEQWDLETKTHIPVTGEGQALMAELHNRVLRAQFDSADALFQIQTHRLYAQWGFDHFYHYTRACWPLGERQIRYYVAIGRRINLLLTTAEEVGEERTAGVRQALMGVNYTRWLELIKIPEEEAKALAAQNEYVAPDGMVYTLKQLTEMSTKELREKLRIEQRVASDQAEEIKTLRAEVGEMQALREGKTTVAQELATRLETTQQELEKLRGERLRGEAGRERIVAMGKQGADALTVLFNYIPRSNLLEFEDWHEEILWAAAEILKLRDSAARYFLRYSERLRDATEEP